jgi:hypothetical protein
MRAPKRGPHFCFIAIKSALVLLLNYHLFYTITFAIRN